MVPRSTAGLPAYLAHRWALTLVGVALVVLAVRPSLEDLAQRLLDSGQPGPARPLLERVLASAKDEPRRAKLHEMLAGIAKDSGDGVTALDHLNGAAAARPTIRLLVEQAHLHALMGRPEEERTSLEAADALYAGWKHTGKPAIAELADGLDLLSPGELPLPGTLTPAFERWYLPHRLRLARLERWQQHHEAALALYRELAPQFEDFGFWSRLERLEAYAGNREASGAALERMAALAPDDVRTFERLAARARDAKDPDGVARWLVRAKLPPDELRRRVLGAYVSMGRADEARARYAALVPHDKDGAAIARALVAAYREAGRAREALPLLRELCAAHPGDAVLARALADALDDAQRPAEAAAVWVRLVQREPRVGEDLARALMALRELTDARAAAGELERILALVPASLAAQRDLGVRYAELRRSDRAVALLQPALERDPEDSDAAYYLGTALGELGRTREALALLSRVAHPAAPEPRRAHELAARPVAAPPRADGPGPVSRRVLALHKRSEGDTTAENLVHQRLEVVLEHLGLAVDHRAVEDGLPSAAELARYRGVVTWYRTGVMAGAAAYARWLDAVLASGLPVMVMEEVGCDRDASGEPLAAELMDRVQARMGVYAGTRWTDDPTRFRIDHEEPGLVAFDRPLAGELDSFSQLESTAPSNQVWLRLRDVADPRVVCDAVVVGPWGALVLSDYALVEETDLLTHAWRVDPFELARRVFRLDRLPRLDVTTRTGCRVAFAHVDGDASDQALYDAPQRTCAEEFLDRVLARRKLPHTVSLIGRLVDPALMDRRTVEVARRLMRHPLVEPAHHSYSHPFDWTSDEVTLPTPGYTKVDPEREILGARDLLNAQICPPDKPVKVLLWSGRCNATGPVLGIAERSGLASFNGGDPRMDAYHASVSHLAPLTRVLDGHVQTLTASANDFVYTDSWTEPRLAYGQVLETFRRTESPRRIYPIDLYYHFYLLAEPGGRAVLDRLYDWIEQQTVHPVFASDHVAAVQGFFSGELELTPAGAWRVTHAGACRTVRFDGETRHVDLARSTGVLGERHEHDALYVHLDASGEATIALTEAAPAMAHVAWSTVGVDALARVPGAVELDVNALVAGRVTLAGGDAGAVAQVELAPSTAPSARTTSQPAWSHTGELTVEVPAPGRWRLRVASRLTAMR